MFKKDKKKEIENIFLGELGTSSPRDRINNLKEINKITFELLSEEILESGYGTITQEYINSFIEVIPEDYLIGLGNHYGGDISLAIKSLVEVYLKEKNLSFDQKELTIKSLTQNMLANKKRQVMYTKLDDPLIFDYLKDFNNQLIDLTDIKISVGIKVFDEDSNGAYSSFVQMYITDNLLEEIINEMKITKKNPTVFNAWEDKKEYKYLKNYKTRTIDKGSYSINIEMNPGSDTEDDSNPPTAKVYILKNL